MKLQVSTTLPEATEAIMTRTIGAAIEVHRRLGPGLAEGLYEDALTIELELVGLAFERQRAVIVHYRGRPLRPQRIDLIVEQQVIVEIKAVEYFHRVHESQLISYLRSTGLRAGLLMNFNADLLKGNIRRIVL